MLENTTTESTSEMRLIDHAAFKDIVELYDEGTEEASNRVGRLRAALRHRRVDPVSLKAQGQLNALKCGVRAVYDLDAHNRGQRWCNEGFRHDLSDDRYSWGSTMAIMSQTYDLDIGEPYSDANDSWSVEWSLSALQWHLEEVASLLDQLSHSMDTFQSDYSGWPIPTYQWAVDILTTVVLESSMKSLWVLRNPHRNPKSYLSHNFVKIWDELKGDQTTVINYVAMLPVTFRCLEPRETSRAQVERLFDTIPEDEWNQSHYWFTSNKSETRISLPFHKFVIALAVFCVAMKVALGTL